MRPDEHKKRKNTQYKKKHGLKTDEKGEGNAKDEVKSSKGAKQASRKPEDAGVASKDEKKSNVSLADDVDVDEKSFSKRKLVSNWSRYDDLPSDDDDDDIPMQRGEDFNKLLAEAGGSAAQFRFRDEEEWSGEVEEDPRPSVLALDLEQIAQSVLCLPLHERLGVEQDLFTTEQLEEMTALASEHQSRCGISDLSATRMQKSRDTGTGNRNPVAKSVNQNTHTTQDKAISFDHGKNTTPASKPDVVTQSDASLTSDRHKNKECDVKCTKGTPKTPVKSAEIASLEDDLDQLLSLDEPVKDSVKATAKSDNVSKDKHTPTTTESNGDMNKADKSNKEAAKDDNLEDWLDSMLDD